MPLQIKTTVFGEDHVYSCPTLMRIGISYVAQKKYAEAMVSFNQARCILDAILGPGHFETSRYFTEIGITHDKLGEYELANYAFDRALQIIEAGLGVGHSFACVLMRCMAVTNMHQGKYEKAIRQLRQTLAIQERTYGVDHLNNAYTIMYIGLVLRFQKCDSESEEYLSRCQRIYQQKLGFDHPQLRRMREIIEEEMKGQQNGQVEVEAT